MEASTPSMPTMQYEPTLTSDSATLHKIRHAQSIEDLIPDAFKKAVAEDETAHRSQQEQRTPHPPRRQQEPVDDDYQHAESNNDTESYEENPIDFSDPDAIDRLIAGDVDALDKPKTNEIEEKPWHTYDSYKQMLQRARNFGVKQDELDRLIEEASDTKVLHSNQYAKGLEEQKKEYETELDYTRKEMDRLKVLERAANFDALPEIQEEYIKPMDGLTKEMRKLLSMESTDVSLQDVLNAPDRVTLVRLFEDANLDDSTMNRISNYWRGYKELEFKYQNYKNSAINDTKSVINERIPKTAMDSLYNNGVMALMNADERYKYIKDAVTNDLASNKEVVDLLSKARTNYNNILKAISNPIDYSRNVKWLENLAKFAVEAEHSRIMEKKYYEANKELDTLKEQRDKLATAYKKLMSSGRGINGAKGIAIKSGGNRRGVEDGADDDKKFMDFLNRKVRIEDLLSS